MRKMVIILVLLAVALSSCKDSQTNEAMQRVKRAQQLVEVGKLNSAKLELDSVHLLYPRQVPVRRLAKQLQDSIAYIEAQRSVVYADSLLQDLLPKVDEQVKKFTWEKQEKYEDRGRYVSRLLATSRNTERCFLQCYVDEGKGVVLKSYYYGTKKINQDCITLSATDNEIRKSGSNHSFQTEGWHEIMSIAEADAMDMLQFMSAYSTERIKVTLSGSGKYAYYLQESEKQALVDSYQLAVLMRDVAKLEEQIKISELSISNYERRLLHAAGSN